MKSTRKALIIGCGQLGTRHLQGLSPFKDVKIDLYDAFPTQYELAKQRWVEVNATPNRLSFLPNLNALENEYELVIVATNADVRYEVLRCLVEKKVKATFLIEKVLFSRAEDYPHAQKLSLNGDARVNHARRLYSGFQKLKSVLGEPKRLRLEVSGNNWGLACNGLHFVDLLLYLLNTNTIDKCEFRELSEAPSNRLGFSEFFGGCFVECGENTASIISNPGSFDGLHINGETDSVKFSIDQSDTIKYELVWKKDSSIEKWQHPIPFQSELTTQVFLDVESKKDTHLPTLENTLPNHEMFVRELEIEAAKLGLKTIKIT